MDTTESKQDAPRRRRPRPKRRRQADHWAWISEAVLATVVVGSALAIGSVHMPVLLAVSVLALIGGAIDALALRRVPWPAVLLAALGLFSALQAVPLPAGFVGSVSPASANVWLHCLVPFGEPALRSIPLSLDAGASIAEALKWLTYASVYIMAMRMRERRGSAWLALLLFGSATLVTLITLTHGVGEFDLLYGVYQPNFAVGRWSVGPLLNSNNLAGYAILGLFSGAGLFLSDRSPLPRLPLAVGLSVISAALCLSGSRAGVASVLLAGTLTVAWLIRGQRVRPSFRALALGLAPLVIGIVIAVALGTASDAGELTSLDARRKMSVWLWSLPMIREHALFGVGRGAFETAFPPYRQALDYDWSIVFTHAENFVVQWVAEWGAPVGLFAVIAIVGYVSREWYGNRGDRLRFTVLTGLIALLVQNLADLGLEVPALAIAAVVALAAGERRQARAANEPAKRQARAANEPARRVGVLALAGSAAAVVLVAAFAWSLMPVELERREMSEAYQQLSVKDAPERARFLGQLREAALRHPGESYFPLLGALVAARTANGKPLPWIARALELEPMNGRVHLALAELLHAHGATAQAMLHLRLAAQYDRTLAGPVSTRAPLWAPTVEMLLQAIPDGPHGEALLLDACAREQRPELKIECFRRAASKDPRSPRARQALAESLLLAMQAGQAPCTGAQLERCAEEAETTIRVLEKLDPEAWRGQYLRSKLLLARGDSQGAALLLQRICPPSAEGEACWQEALATAIKSGSESVISGAANAFAGRPCGDSESCAEMLSALASTLESGAQPALANTFYTKAAEADPSAVRWLKVAEHATDAHLYGVARMALDRADRSPDIAGMTRAKAEMLRERVVRAAAAPL